jgi:hypothetical protein
MQSMSLQYSLKLPAGSLRYQKKFGPSVMAAQAPDVSLGMILEHGLGASADLVDVIDLPGRVVQERDGSLHNENVVMVAGAAQERAGAPDMVADLEAETLDEEGFGRGVVCRRQDGMPELAWPDRPVRSTPGARWSKRSLRPGPLYLAAGTSDCSERPAISR